MSAKLQNTKSTPDPTDQSYRKRQLRRRILIFAIITVTIVSVALVLFAWWLNSSHKALLDAADHALREPAVYTVKSDDTTLRVQVAEGAYHAKGVLDGLDIEMIVSDNTLYVRSADFAELLAKTAGEQTIDLSSKWMQPIIDKMKNKWVSINLQTPSLPSDMLNALYCGVDGRSLLAHGSAVRQRLATTYLSHQFIVLGPVTQTGTDASYDISFDEQKLETFQSALRKTDFYQLVVSCAETAYGSFDAAVLADMRATVVLTQDHYLKELTVRDGAGKTTRVTATYDSQSPVEPPANAMTLDQITNEFFRSLMAL